MHHTARLPVPIVLSASRQRTFFHKRNVIHHWAISIRKRVLERSEQVVEAPCDNHVVIYTHQEWYHDGREPHSTQVGVNSIPRTNRSLAQTLTDRQLHEKERNAQCDQTEEIRDQKGTWKNKKMKNFSQLLTVHSRSREQNVLEKIAASKPVRYWVLPAVPYITTTKTRKSNIKINSTR